MRVATGHKVKGGRRAIASLLLAACGLVATAATADAQQDRILLKDGKDKSVKIKSENFDGVWYATTTGADQMTGWNKIDSIVYSGGDDYQKAVAAFAAGRYSDALAQLDQMVGNAQLRPVLRQNALYHAALAQTRLGKPDEAVAKYTLLLQEFPKSRYISAIGANLLSIFLAKDDVTGAARALDPVLAKEKDSASDEALRAALGVLRGRLLEEQKKWDDAEQAFSNASKSTKADTDVIAAGKLGLARCAHKRGQLTEAEKSFREIAKSDAPNWVLAGAWNGLGDLALEQATAKRDQDGLRVALLSYLRGVVLYVPAQGDASEEHERSLAGATRASKAVGELESKAELKKQFLDRARQLKGQLTNLYPGSRFLKGL